VERARALPAREADPQDGGVVDNDTPSSVTGDQKGTRIHVFDMVVS
jgi:hypothetical protein